MKIYLLIRWKCLGDVYSRPRDLNVVKKCAPSRRRTHLSNSSLNLANGNAEYLGSLLSVAPSMIQDKGEVRFRVLLERREASAKIRPRWYLLPQMIRRYLVRIGQQYRSLDYLAKLPDIILPGYCFFIRQAIAAGLKRSIFF
jgi:hypothetical protein